MNGNRQSLEAFLQSEQDLATWPGAFAAQKKKIVLEASFADQEGVIETLEGPVKYYPGDAIITGVKNEQWPVPKDNFHALYKPIAGVVMGQQGRYVKRPLKVIALVSNKDLFVALPKGVGELHAKPSDVIVQYALGDYAVVDSDIFDKTYDRLE